MEESAAAILAKAPNAKLRFVLLDLCSLKSVREVSQELNQLSTPIDVLIANAGIVNSSPLVEEDDC